jgi:hypothetical protein
LGGGLNDIKRTRKGDEMKNERGFILVLCLMLLLVMTLLGVAGMQTGNFGNMIAGNGLEGQKAFWIAEAGLQDAKDKLNSSVSVDVFRNLTGLSTPVVYGGGTYTITTEPDLSYPTSRVIVRSVGVRNDGSRKVVETTMVKFFFDGPGALYSEAMVKVHGQCEINGGEKPGIVTTLPEHLNGNDTVTINGASAHVIGQGIEPSIRYNWTNVSIAQYVSFLKGYASPTPSGNVWGASSNPIVVSLIGDQRLGGRSGYGIILVEGNLDVHGGMDWSGIIIVTGTISFTGGGNDKVNITGSIMSGEATNIGTDLSDFGGSMVLRYADLNYLRQNLGTVRTISWREVK